MHLIRWTAIFLALVASCSAQNVVGDCADVYDSGTGYCQVPCECTGYTFQLRTGLSSERYYHFRAVAAIASTATVVPPTTNSMWSSVPSKTQRGTTAIRRESHSLVWTGLSGAARLSKQRMLSTKECKDHQ